MSDAARRAAGRSGDAGRALLERVRAGELDRPRLVLAARLGSRAARLALGEPPPGLCWPELAVEDEPEGLTERVLAAADPEPLVRAALAALVLGERALPRFETGDVTDSAHVGLLVHGLVGATDLVEAWLVLALAERADDGLSVDLRDADGVARQLPGLRWRWYERTSSYWQHSINRLEAAVGKESLGRALELTHEAGTMAVVVEASVGAYVLGRSVGFQRHLAEGWQRRGFDARAERRATAELAAANDDAARGMAHAARAQARAALGDLPGAETDWERAVQLRPDAVGPRWGRGLLRWAQGDLIGAAETLGEAGALTHDRWAPQARLDRARVLLALGRYSEAVSEADGLLTDPAGVLDTAPAGRWADARRAALVVRASARRLAGRPDLALADADAAVAARRGDVWPLLERARVHESRGDVARMRADADAALRFAPELSAALAARAQARALANDLTGALEDLRAAVARRPDEPTHREELGRLLLAMGRPDEGQRELDEARRLAPWRMQGPAPGGAHDAPPP